MKRLICLTALIVWSSLASAAEPLVVDLWPGKPPGEAKELPPESDQTKPEDRLIAGRRIIKLGNVSTPQLAVYRPAKEIDTGAAVVICPGGGHHILAYDLEGTEVAEWLNGLGVTGIVLKYRVPFRDPQRRWLSGVQDGQRAMSIVRSKAADWEIDPKRLGMLGFSAGGDVTARVALFGDQRHYEPVDLIDAVSSRPDFSVLVYSGGLYDKDKQALRDDLKLSKEAPPTFLVHAFDDGVPVQNTLLVAAALKEAGVPAEAHVFAAGGHGYGLRAVKDEPVTEWPKLCEAWLRKMKIIP